MVYKLNHYTKEFVHTILGIHHWKVKVSHAVQNTEDCSLEEPIFEVGVIEASDDYSEANIRHGKTVKWVYSGKAKHIAHILLNLDIHKKSLQVSPGGNILGARSKFSFRQKTFDVNAHTVFPFFSVNCPHCSLTLVQ